MGKPIKLSEAELNQLVENIEKAGGDASELKNTLRELRNETMVVSNPPVRRRAWPVGEVAKPREFKVLPLVDDEGYLFGFRVIDPSEKLLMSRKALLDRLCEEYPKLEELRAWLEDAAIAYDHYEAKIELPEKVFFTPRLKMMMEEE